MYNNCSDIPVAETMHADNFIYLAKILHELKDQLENNNPHERTFWLKTLLKIFSNPNRNGNPAILVAQNIPKKAMAILDILVKNYAKTQPYLLAKALEHECLGFKLVDRLTYMHHCCRHLSHLAKDDTLQAGDRISILTIISELRKNMSPVFHPKSNKTLTSAILRIASTDKDAEVQQHAAGLLDQLVNLMDDLSQSSEIIHACVSDARQKFNGGQFRDKLHAVSRLISVCSKFLTLKYPFIVNVTIVTLLGAASYMLFWLLGIYAIDLWIRLAVSIIVFAISARLIIWKL